MASVTLAWGFGALLAALLSALVMLLLRRHMPAVLSELGGSQPRAHFWAAVLSLCVLLLGLFAGTGPYNIAEIAKEGEDRLFFELVSQVRWALGGLFVSVIVVSMLVMRLVSRHEEALKFAKSPPLVSR